MTKYLIQIQYYEEITTGISCGTNKRNAVYNFIKHILEVEQAENNGYIHGLGLPLFWYNADISFEENINYYIDRVLDFSICCIELKEDDTCFFVGYGTCTNDKYDSYVKK